MTHTEENIQKTIENLNEDAKKRGLPSFSEFMANENIFEEKEGNCKILYFDRDFRKKT